MKGLLKILGILFFTTLGLVLFTQYEPDRLTSISKIGGYPVIEIAQVGPRGWIAIGQVDARGVLVFAQLGFGLVAVIQGGVGAIFCVGHVAVGLVLIAQAGVGFFFFLGQAGLGRQAWGQAVFKSRPYIKALSAEFSEILSFRRGETKFSRYDFELKEADTPSSSTEGRSASRKGDWPQSLAAALPNRGAGASIALREGTLTVEPWRLVFDDGSDGQKVVIDEANTAVVQLSRSQRPQKWAALRALFGRDPWQHVLHVEIRTSHKRVSLNAPMPAETLKNLRYMERRGSSCGAEPLLDLLSTAKIIDLPVAIGDVEGSSVKASASLSKRVVVFEGLKSLIRVPVVLLYCSPLLLVPKLILWVLGVLAGDWITVAFVILVVALFTLIAILMMMFPWVGEAKRACLGDLS